MKYLKLDAGHKECHGLARALVGSPIREGEIDIQLLGTCDFAGHIGFVVAVDPWNFCSRAVILLPLDTLKLCPYVAMREGVGVVAYYDNSTYCDRTTGTIFNATSEGNFSFHAYGNEYGVEEIHLDLDNLPKGAEVVEL